MRLFEMVQLQYDILRVFLIMLSAKHEIYSQLVWFGFPFTLVVDNALIILNKVSVEKL